jgi:hypothetical protein
MVSRSTTGAGRLDLEDFGAKIGYQLAAILSRDTVGQLQNAKMTQR